MILNNGKCLNFLLITCFLLLMRLLGLHGVADGFVGKLQKKFHLQQLC